MKGKAGMGNRLLCVFTALRYAELTGRELVVDWSDRCYSEDRADVFGRLFETPSAGDMRPWLDSSSVHPPRWVGRIHRSVDEFFGELFPHNTELDTDRSVARTTTVDLAADVPEEVAVRWAWDDEIHRLRPWLKGDEARMSDDEILRKIVKERFVFAPAVREPIDTFTAAHFHGPMIGVHVRFTDRRNPFAHYHWMIDYIRSFEPEARIFLATDNPRVEDEFRTRYGDRVCTTVKWFPDDGRPIHKCWVQPDKLSLAIEALVDMVLLSRTNFLIVNKTSTFGKVAHLLADPAKTKTIDATPVTVRSLVKDVKRQAEHRLLAAKRSGAFGLLG